MHWQMPILQWNLEDIVERLQENDCHEKRVGSPLCQAFLVFIFFSLATSIPLKSKLIWKSDQIRCPCSDNFNSGSQESELQRSGASEIHGNLLPCRTTLGPCSQHWVIRQFQHDQGAPHWGEGWRQQKGCVVERHIASHDVGCELKRRRKGEAKMSNVM